jgi:hypothetical protein
MLNWDLFANFTEEEMASLGGETQPPSSSTS